MTSSGKLKIVFVLIVMLCAFIEFKKEILPTEPVLLIFSALAPALGILLVFVLNKEKLKTLKKPSWNHSLKLTFFKQPYALSYIIFFSATMIAFAIGYFISGMIYQNGIWKSAISFALIGVSSLISALLVTTYLEQFKNGSFGKSKSIKPQDDLDAIINEKSPEREIDESDFENLR